MTSPPIAAIATGEDGRAGVDLAEEGVGFVLFKHVSLLLIHSLVLLEGVYYREEHFSDRRPKK